VLWHGGIGARSCGDPETFSYENAINPTREFLCGMLPASAEAGHGLVEERFRFHSPAPLE